MRKRKRACLFAACGVLILAAIYFAFFYSPEPTFKGYTMHQWLERTEPGLERATDEQRLEALHTLGTNNLDLLVRRICSDPEKGLGSRIAASLPKSVTPKFVLRFFRGISWASGAREDGLEVIRALGPLAGPAIPQFAYAATNGTGLPAMWAWQAMENIGEPPWVVRYPGSGSLELNSILNSLLESNAPSFSHTTGHIGGASVTNAPAH